MKLDSLKAAMKGSHTQDIDNTCAGKRQYLVDGAGFTAALFAVLSQLAGVLSGSAYY